MAKRNELAMSQQLRRLESPVLTQCKPLRQEVDEGAHFGRQMSAARVHGIDGRSRQAIILEQRYETAGAYFRRHDEIWFEKDAEPSDSQGREHESIVGTVTQWDLDFTAASVCTRFEL